MNTPLHEVIETDDGLSCARAVVTSIQVHGELDGTTSLIMSDGTTHIRLFASAAQIAHLVRVLQDAARLG